MRNNFRQISRIALCLFGFFECSAQVQAQYSVYDKLTGIIPPTSDNLESHPGNRYLKATLHSRYDNILKIAMEDEQFEFSRWSYGASFDWKISKNQRWQVQLLRTGEVARASTVDSSWHFKSMQRKTILRIAYLRAFGKLPISIMPHFQIHEESNRSFFNYGIGLFGTLQTLTFGFKGEYRNWSPFYQYLLNNSTGNIEVYFPTLANIRQIEWSVSGKLKGIDIESYVRAGRLISSNRYEKEYTFRPSGDIRAFMVSLQRKQILSSHLKFSVLWEDLGGDGVLRFRDRKYGDVSLHDSYFFDTRLSLARSIKRTAVEAGFAYQKLSRHGNVSIQAWPFDDSGIDFFKAKQSMSGGGDLTLMRSQFQSTFFLSNRFQTTVLAEYIYTTIQSQVKTRGSALIFVSGEIDEYNLDTSQDFVRIGLSSRLVLSKVLDVNIKINQWIPLGIDVDQNFRIWSGKGGTFGQVVLRFCL